MKTKRNAENEKARMAHLEYLAAARRRSPASVERAAAAIDEFDAYNGRMSFKRFHERQAIGFRNYLDKQTNQRTGKPLSKATILGKLTALREFFVWLSWQPGYKSKVTRTAADYFSITDNEVRIATARHEPQGPTLEQIRCVLETMPTSTAIERRDRAVVAFALLSGCRISAIASLKVKHIDLAQRRITQDAREVRTKRAKSFVSHFFPVGENVRKIVEAWIEELLTVHLWGPDDPLFPKTQVAQGDNQAFRPVGLLREHWGTTEPIRKIFRRAFAAAGLPYHNPHSFRHTLGQLPYRLDLNSEQLRVWSLNYGHDDVMTTLVNYGPVPLARQRDVLFELAEEKSRDAKADELANKVSRLIREWKA